MPLLERVKQRIQTRAIEYAILGAAGFCVILFLAVACYFSLLGPFGPAGAAAMTAGAGTILIGLVLLVSRTGSSPGPAGASGESPQDPADRIEAMLEARADPVLKAWVRDNPDRAVVTTLALGVAAGYSESVRRALSDLYSQYTKAETSRRRG